VIHSDSSAVRETGSDQWTLAGVLALWAGMSMAGLGWIAVYGYNLPFWEDWFMVGPLVGREVNLLNWLWAQNNEHRVPLAKAIYLVLLKASGGDFRIGMVANLFMLAGVCLAMILTARHLRKGQTRLADAFFPLVLLNLGYWEIVGWGWSITYVLWATLVYLWLIIIVCEPWPLPPKPAIAAGLASVSLPLSGANGVLFTPFIAFWLIAGLLFYRRDMNPKWLIPFLAGCVAVSIALSGLYLVGLSLPFKGPQNPGAGSTVLAALRFVGMAIGPGGSAVVPDKLITGFFSAMTCLLLASTVIPLYHGFHSFSKSERFRIFSLLLFAAAMTALVLGMARKRPAGAMADRYALLFAPALCAAYLVWVLYGPKSIRDRISLAFVVAVLLAFPFNLREGAAWTADYTAKMATFELDLSSKLSWQGLVEKDLEDVAQWTHNPEVARWTHNPEVLVESMRLLNESKIGPIGRVAPR
jgi:hypothetical protein